MSQHTTVTDGGDENNADDESVELPTETVTTVDALVELLDEDVDSETAQERASRIMEVLEETGATLLKLQSSWHGNEFIGDWKEFWFAHIDFETDKAIHMSEVIDAAFPMRMVGKLRREREGASPNKRGIERYEERAFKNWERVKQKTDSWGEPNYWYDTDEYCPKTAIVSAISAPSRDDHFIFTHEGKQRGTLDEAELAIRKTVTHEFESNGMVRREEKFAVEGDTYEAFVSANLKNVLPFMDVTDDDDEIIEKGTFHDYNGEYWVVGMDGLQTFIDYTTEAGFTVGVHSDFEEYFDSSDSARD